MKVTAPNTTPTEASAYRTSKASGVSAKQGTLAGGTSNGDETNHLTGERSFASVLETVTRAHESHNSSTEECDDTTEHDPSDDTTSCKSADDNHKARGRDEKQQETDNSGQGFERRGVREVRASQELTTTAPAVRAILHIADLERMVAAARTQVIDGRREVTLELSRSVLEGLRVKLRTNEAGRIDVEFIAVSERIRAQIDARTPELTNLLRSRGIPLQTLKTSVDADSSSQQDAGENRKHPFSQFAVEANRGREIIELIPEADSNDISEDKDLTNRTMYRA